jgi:predicted ATPase
MMEFHATDLNKSPPTSRNKSQKPPNIYLIGPQCAGKTTLLEALRAYYAIDASREFENQRVECPAIIEEVVRRVMHGKGFNVQDLKNVDRGFELQQRILLEQYNAEEILQDEWYISDRSGLDALVYAKAYIGVSAAKKLENTGEWNRLQKRMQDAVVVFCEAGNADWLSEDEVRMAYSNTAEWERLNKEFHAMLIQHDIGYIILPKHVRDLQERVALIKNTLGMNSQDRADIPSLI